MNAESRRTAAMAPFLRGSFRSFSLEEIFGVLAVSRQIFDIRFSDADGEVGAITVKAGQVIGAEDSRSRAEGAEALKSLAGDPGTAFAVTMLPRNSPKAQAEAVIGGLGELIGQTDGRHAEAARPLAVDTLLAVPDDDPGHEPGLDRAEPEPPGCAASDWETGGVSPVPAPLTETVPDAPGDDPGDEPGLDRAELEPPGCAAFDWEIGGVSPVPAPLTETVPDAPDDDPGDEPGLDRAEPEPPGFAASDGRTEDGPTAPAPPEEPSAGDAEVILQGNVSDASFEEMLEVLQLSELSLAVSFMRGGAAIGTLTVISEQVLSASAGELQGVAAFRQLYADHGETFEVRRTAQPVPDQALGSVAELLADARQRVPSAEAASEPESERSPFMRGRLSDFPLHFIVGSLDLSRQSMELVLGRDGKILHRVYIKAGRVAAVDSAAAEGVAAALAAIRADPGDEFLVYRRPGTIAGPSVAPLAALIVESGPPPAEAQPHDRGGGPLAAPEIRDRDGAPAEVADARALLSQTATAVARLLVDLEDTHNGAVQEIRAALAGLAQRRADRLLLRLILAVQGGCLIVTLALLALALF